MGRIVVEDGVSRQTWKIQAIKDDQGVLVPIYGHGPSPKMDYLFHQDSPQMGYVDTWQAFNGITTTCPLETW